MATTCFRMLFCQMQRFTARTSKLKLLSKSRRNFAFLVPPIVFCEMKSQQSAECDENKLQPPDPSTLTTEYLIRNTSLVVIDAATSLFTQTTTALLDIEKDYAKALDVLITLMEFKLKILDNETELQQVLDYILQIRQKLDKLQQKKKYLDMMYITSTNLLSNAAEAAFMSGSEYKGILANETLRCSEQEVQQARLKTLLEEKRLHDIETETIHRETKHEEDKKKRKEQQSVDSTETVKQADLMKELGQTQKVEEQINDASRLPSSNTPEDIFDSERNWDEAQDEYSTNKENSARQEEEEHGEDVWDTEKEFRDSQQSNEDNRGEDKKSNKSWKWW